MNTAAIAAAAGTMRSVLHRPFTVSTYLSASKSGTQQGKKSSGSGGSSPSASSNVAEPPTFVFKDVKGQDIMPSFAGKDRQYKNPEYFSYHEMSYADMDVVMAKMRCPQPSSLKK